MANNDFFEDNKEEIQEVDKIKVGDQEFSADELDELVGAGRKLKELEEKLKQPVDNIVSDWGKRGELLGQTKKEKEEALAELEKYKNPPTKEEVDQEALRKSVLEELKGYGIPTKDEIQSMINEIYQTNRQGEQILSKVKRVAREAKADGRPETSPEELLQFMQEQGLRDPEVAYKVKYEKQLEDWRAGQLSKAKGQTMVTETKSTAGAKTPDVKSPTTKEERNNALRSVLWGEGGQQ